MPPLHSVAAALAPSLTFALHASALGPPPPAGESVQVNLDFGGEGGNRPGDAANEPSLAVDPTAPNRLAIGWRQFDTVMSSFRQAGVASSRDGGRTWQSMGVIEPGVFRTDPVLDYDADGRFYYNSLRTQPNFNSEIFTSDDGGFSWSGPTFAFGGDKQWMAIDRTGGIGRGNIYQAWNTAGNQYFPRTFNRSIDGGMTFSEPIEIPRRPIFGILGVAPDGAVYVSGRQGPSIVITRSSDAQDPGVGVPMFELDRVVELGGAFRVGGNPNPGGLVGQVQIAADHSGGPTHGNIYLLCSVDPTGPDPLDIFFARSSDRGGTWSAPVRINTDAPSGTAWQWFGTMSVAPNGRIDAVWNDTRDSNGSVSVLYYTFSTDAGQTWSPEAALSAPWNSLIGWPMQNKIGDYYDMESDFVGAHLAWAATFNGEQDVYYLRIGDYDCNGNGVADAADLDSGAARDCNANGVPDSCEIAAGAAPDKNGNGVPDACDEACIADWNLDGGVDSDDYFAFLNDFFTFPRPPRIEQIYGPIIDSDDFFAYLTEFFEGCP